MKGGILLAVVIAIFAVGCGRQTPSNSIADTQPVVAAATSDSSIWDLSESDERFCTYKQGKLTTTLEKPAAGCTDTITVGDAGIE